MLLWTSACNPGKYCARKFPEKITVVNKVDTIWKEKPYFISFPADTSKIVIPRIEIENFGGKPVIRIRKSDQSSIKVVVDSSGITAEAICAKQDSIIKILEAEIKSKETITSVQHIEVKKVPKRYQWAMYWSLVSIPLFIVWVFAKLKKLFTIF